jgi:hypothetical protein
MGPNFVHLSTPNSAAILCRQISTDLRSRQQPLRSLRRCGEKPGFSGSCFREWIGGLVGVVKDIIALDGKTVRGSKDGVDGRGASSRCTGCPT